MEKVYFIGIGGIGMSAIARYFKAQGCEVAGYDRTETPLTQQLAAEGIAVHYQDDVGAIPASFKADKKETLVIYTPAIPASHTELNFFKDNGFRLIKRSEALGEISRTKKTIAVSGTHGKTSVSTMIAHILTASGKGCDAFLGGISKNYGTNLLLHDGSSYVVAEADEYDRSFLRLHPYIAIVTAMDADHLDIYGTHEALQAAFRQFVSQTANGGHLLAKYGLPIEAPDGVCKHSYSLNDSHADYFAHDVHIENGRYCGTLTHPAGDTPFSLSVPGLVNVENAVAAMAAAHIAGVEPYDAMMAMASFEGVQRRFDYRVRTDKCVYIDDYGHHPEELRFTIESVRCLYPSRRITGIFQPHLYTRTRDFVDGFAASLSLLDELILLDIYPAREEPLPGVTSGIIFDKVTIADKKMCRKEDVPSLLAKHRPDVLLTLGAGDIDTLVSPIERLLQKV